MESGNFEEAPALISSYGKYVAGAIEAASALQERLAVISEALDFLQDRLHLARVMRAHLAAQLTSVSRQSSYLAAPHNENRWTLEG